MNWEREWSRITVGEFDPDNPTRVVVNVFDDDLPEEDLRREWVAALLDDPRADLIEDLLVERWGPRADIRPWMQALGARVPKRLRSFGAGPESSFARATSVGDIATLGPLLDQLEELDIQSKADEFTPFTAPRLRSFVLTSDEPPADRLSNVLARSRYDKLETLVLYLSGRLDGPLEESVLEAAVYPLLRRRDLPNLRELRIETWITTPRFVEELARGGLVESLEALTWTMGLKLPAESEPEALEAIAEVLVAHRDRLARITMKLPEELAVVEERLAAAGLRCTFGW